MIAPVPSLLTDEITSSKFPFLFCGECTSEIDGNSGAKKMWKSTHFALKCALLAASANPIHLNNENNNQWNYEGKYIGVIDFHIDAHQGLLYLLHSIKVSHLIQFGVFKYEKKYTH